MSPTLDPIIETERTYLRLPSTADAVFMLKLLNDPEFIRFTGDRGIRDLSEARTYIAEKLIGLHQEQGFTLYVVKRRTDGELLEISGLVKRPNLDAPDIGFGFLTEHCGQGIGTETARAVLTFAHQTLGYRKLYGITQSDNHASIRLLGKIGLTRKRT